MSSIRMAPLALVAGFATRSQPMAMLMLVLGGFVAGCTPQIELVGYGTRPIVQHGLQAELLNDGPNGALIVVQNISSNVLSLNQSAFAMKVVLNKREGESLKEVKPWGHILHEMKGSPHPDDFVILAPQQTRKIPVPVSYKKDKYSTLSAVYKIEKGFLYEVTVRLDPYFGTFTPETAGKTLKDFQIPNYLFEPVMLNNMVIRAR